MDKGPMPLFGASVSLLSMGCSSWPLRSAVRAPRKRSSCWSPKVLERAAAYAREIGSAAALVLEDGQAVFSFGDLAHKYDCHSIRKPFLNALYGIYIARGVIDLDATLEQLDVDDIPPSLGRAERQATIGDLLLSRSGIYHEAAGEHPAMIKARPERCSHPPGSFFYYNNWDFNALGTIFEQLTGKRVFGAFYEDIAAAIGMEDFCLADCSYSFERARSEHPAYFFRMSTRDMARFGLLYQNFGSWKGEQVVPEQWIRQSTAVYPAENAAGDPYGYLWRIIPEDAGVGHGFYHAGLGVHLLAVLPERKLVLVHRVDTDGDFDARWSQVRTLVNTIVSARGYSD